MALNQKSVFWEALIVAVFIFLLGITAGFLIENSRTEKVLSLYLNSETNLLDSQIQSTLIDSVDNCDFLIANNIEFGDRIYQDALLLQRYEESTKLTRQMREQHRKYDLLRVMFWMDSKKIQEKCPESFDILVYLYEYKAENVMEKAKQTIFSNYLSDLKNERGNEILLIPIANNMNLASLDLLLADFEITTASILINSEFVIGSVEDLERVRSYLSLNP